MCVLLFPFASSILLLDNWAPSPCSEVSEGCMLRSGSNSGRYILALQFARLLEQRSSVDALEAVHGNCEALCVFERETY